jgi:hypothetical protein
MAFPVDKVINLLDLSGQNPYVKIMIPLIKYLEDPRNNTSPWEKLAAATLLQQRLIDWGGSMQPVSITWPPKWWTDGCMCNGRWWSNCENCGKPPNQWTEAASIDKPPGFKDFLTGLALEAGMSTPFTTDVLTFERNLEGLIMDGPNDYVY